MADGTRLKQMDDQQKQMEDIQKNVEDQLRILVDEKRSMDQKLESIDQRLDLVLRELAKLTPKNSEKNPSSSSYVASESPDRGEGTLSGLLPTPTRIEPPLLALLPTPNRAEHVNPAAAPANLRREVVEPMSDSSTYLPQELIRDILIRLPVKSIGRFRCVSKAWHSLLTSSDIIRSHLYHHTLLAKEQNLLLLSSIDHLSSPWIPSQSLFTLNLHPDSHLSRDLKPRFKGNLRWLVGSCHGLVLVVTEEDGKRLINPTTLEYAELPDSPLALNPSTRVISFHGFGYDSSSDDYKIVALSFDDQSHDVDYYNDTFIDIYSVKMRSWRRFGSIPCEYAYIKRSSGVFVNGSLHWICWKFSSESSLIAAFDLSSETLEEIPAPPSLDKAKLIDYKLVVVERCLGIAALLNHCKPLEVWFMNNYRSVESWTKIAIDMECTYCHGPNLCILKNKMLWEDGEKFRWYHPHERRWDDWMAIGEEYEFVECVTFLESLVSPHFNVNN